MNHAAKCDITLKKRAQKSGLSYVFEIKIARTGDLFLLVGNGDVETAIGSAGHGVALTDQGHANQQRTAGN